MSLNQFKKDKDIQGASDNLGGGSFIKDSGIYKVIIDMAYLGKSQGGALGLHLHLKHEDANITKHTLWVTSGNAKGNKPYYVTKQGNKAYLPGFNMADTMCELVTGKEFGDLDTEEKAVLVYNFDAKKEIPTKVDVLTDLIGKQVKVGLIKQVVDKNIKNDNGVYVPSGETREENEIDKWFNIDTDQTLIELKGETTADLLPKWKEKWDGQVKMKAKGGAKTGAVAGAPVTAAGASPTASAPTTKPLFG